MTMFSTERARWYVNRLRSMPLREIPHRFAEAGKRAADRRGSMARRACSLPSSVLAAPLPALPLDVASTRTAATEAQRATLRVDCAELLEGTVRLLGRTWTGGRTQWFHDPESGRSWDRSTYCFDVVRGQGRGIGDAKISFELSRLQQLQVLGLGAAVLGDADATRACRDDVLAWWYGNPPFFGPHWSSGIELASRVVSVLTVVGLVGASAFDETATAAVWALLAAHGNWIVRYPSLHSSANNHLIAEAVGAYVLGVLAPGLPGAAAWERFGIETLAYQVERQFHPDGVSCEQSPTYGAYTVEWYLVARRAAMHAGRDWPPHVDARLAAACRHILDMADEGGNVPRIGDDDESVVLRTQMAREPYALEVARTGAALLDAGVPAAAAASPSLRAMLLGVRPGPAGEGVGARSASYPHGGYTILRAGPAGATTMAVLDHGPHGHLRTSGHGHADSLAVWVHRGRQPILVDSGTYRYDHDGGWRNFMRSTAAHNALQLDGRSQSETTGPFNWGARANGRLEELDLAAPAPFVQGTTDAWASLGVVHKRRLELDVRGTAVITDCLEGRGTHRVTLLFHFSPDLRLDSTADPVEWMVRQGECDVLRVHLFGSGLVSRALRGATSPGPGAYSPAYNLLVDNTALVAEAHVTLPWEATTRFDFASPCARPR